jgi:hypothetical protein
MAWTNKQKSLFAQACTAIGYDQDRRRMVLSSFPNAIAGKSYPTSTSKRLNNADFEHAMAIVESASGNQIKVRWSATGKLRFGMLHFARKANDDLARMRRLVGAIAGALEDAGNLEPNGVGLAGWISSRITKGRTDRIDQLTYNELYNLIEGLKAYARRNGVRLDK